MITRMLIAPALFLALFAFTADAQIRWSWSFASESGYFVTNGQLVNGTAPAGQYFVRDFAVTESVHPDHVGSMRNGDYNEGSYPGTAFRWNGTKDTQWSRGAGRYTNGADYDRVDRLARYAFNPVYKIVYRQGSTLLASGSMTFVPGPNAELDLRGVATPGGSVTFSLSAWDQARRPYLLASSLGRGPIPIGSRKLHLSYDGLFLMSAFGLAPTVFQSYSGALSRSGDATATLQIVNEQALVGITIHSAYVVLDPNAPDGVSAISETESFTIQ